MIIVIIVLLYRDTKFLYRGITSMVTLFTCGKSMQELEWETVVKRIILGKAFYIELAVLYLQLDNTDYQLTMLYQC